MFQSLSKSFSKKITAFISPVLLVLILITGISACGQNDNNQSTASKLTNSEISADHKSAASGSLLEKIKQRGKLIVLTSNYATSYYYDRDNQLAGPEYDMTQQFAKHLKVDVEYKVFNSTKEVIDALRNNKGDIAAATLTINNKRELEFDYGPVYQEIQEYIVCHRKTKRIKNRDALKNLTIVVASGSSYIESLKSYPEIKWTEDPTQNTTLLLENVAKKKINCTISDSHLFDIERRYHTEIQNKYTLSKSSNLAWMFAKNNPELKKSLNNWFKKIKGNGDLAQVLEKYYGYTEIFDYVDTHKFLDRLESRLPKYKKFFIDAATKNDIEPTLLTAQSYQESHWNRRAKSPTGVRGIMMLTQPVAKSMGVTNRLHAKQNIYAGAKFLAKMKKMVKHVDEPDRTWLALAAYNVGRGHFRDAQSLAKKLNKDPDRWSEMKEILPLLSEKKYHKDLRYGYARGNEPVQYVTRIRSYEELLLPVFETKK